MARYARGMDANSMTPSDRSAPKVDMRAALARCDFARRSQVPVLAHLLGAPVKHSINAEIVARVRSAIEHLAAQLAAAAFGDGAKIDQGALALVPPTGAEREIDALTAQFWGWPELLEHVLARVLEGQLALDLEQRHSLDPVLSPLFQELIASERPERAQLAMAALTAQARFIESFRRMRLPVLQLSAELFSALVERGARILARNGTKADAARVERGLATLRTRYDEAETREGLFSQLIAALGRARCAALDLEHAGVALFSSALAESAGTARANVVGALQAAQHPLLVTQMRAAGLERERVVDTIEFMRGDWSLCAAALELDTERARDLLAELDSGAFEENADG